MYSFENSLYQIALAQSDEHLQFFLQGERYLPYHTLPSVRSVAFHLAKEGKLDQAIWLSDQVHPKIEDIIEYIMIGAHNGNYYQEFLQLELHKILTDVGINRLAFYFASLGQFEYAEDMLYNDEVGSLGNDPSYVRNQIALGAAAGGHFHYAKNILMEICINKLDLNYVQLNLIAQGAALGGQFHYVEKLLRGKVRKANIDAVAKGAARGGHFIYAEELLDDGAHIDSLAEGAARGRHFDAVKKYLNQGASIDAVVMGAAASSCWWNDDYVKALINQGANPNAAVLGFMLTGDIEKRTEESFLDAVDINVFAQGAAEAGNGDLAMTYMQRGADCSLIALSAAKVGFFELAEILLHKGADIKNVILGANLGGYRDYADLLLEYDSGVNIHLIARRLAKRGKMSDVGYLLREGASLSVVASGAAEGGYILFAKQLLQQGADINAVAIGAAAGNHINFVEELVEQGADINVVAIGVGQAGNHSYCGSLIAKGADINYVSAGAIRSNGTNLSKDLNAITILSSAQEDDAGITEFLLNHKNADINYVVAGFALSGQFTHLDYLLNGNQDIDINFAIIGAALGGYSKYVSCLLKKITDKSNEVYLKDLFKQAFYRELAITMFPMAVGYHDCKDIFVALDNQQEQSYSHRIYSLARKLLTAIISGIAKAYTFDVFSQSGLAALQIYPGAITPHYNPCPFIPKNPIDFWQAGTAGDIVGILNIINAIYPFLALGSHFASAMPVMSPNMNSPYVIRYHFLTTKQYTPSMIIDGGLLSEISSERIIFDERISLLSESGQSWGKAVAKPFKIYNMIIGGAGIFIVSNLCFTGALNLSKGRDDLWWNVHTAVGGFVGTGGQLCLYIFTTNWQEPEELLLKSQKLRRGFASQPATSKVTFLLRSLTTITFRALTFAYRGELLPATFDNYTQHYLGKSLLSGPSLYYSSIFLKIVAGLGGAQMGLLASLREAKQLAQQQPETVEYSISGMIGKSLDLLIGKSWRPRGRPTLGRGMAYLLFLAVTAIRTIDMNAQAYDLFVNNPHNKTESCVDDSEVMINQYGAIASTMVSVFLIGAAAQQQSYYMPAVSKALETLLGFFGPPSASGLDDPRDDDIADLTDEAMRQPLNDAQVRVLYEPEELEPKTAIGFFRWLTGDWFSHGRISSERCETARRRVTEAKQTLWDSVQTPDAANNSENSAAMDYEALA
jgi:hypothetical protein